MKWTIHMLFFAVTIVLQPAAAGDPNQEGFEKLRSLVGEWETVLPDGKSMRITYEEINGGVIEERYRSEDPMWWNMSSIYYLDNGRIMMSHYCSWGNHPRMAAVAGDEIERLDFRFLDMTHTQPDNGYMKHVSFDFEDDSNITHHWVWHEKGKETPLTLTLVRKQ